MNFQNLLSRRKILSKVFNSHMVCYIAINTFVNFEISGAFFNPSLNTLRLINEFEKCIPSFLEGLIANFIQFSSAIAKFLFLKGRLDTRLCVRDYLCTQFRDFTTLFPYCMSFDNLWCNSYIQFVVIILSLFHLRWKEPRLVDKKVSKYFMRVCSSSEVGSVKTYVEKWLRARFLFESVLRFAKTSLFS